MFVILFIISYSLLYIFVSEFSSSVVSEIQLGDDEGISDDDFVPKRKQLMSTSLPKCEISSLEATQSASKLAENVKGMRIVSSFLF